MHSELMHRVGLLAQGKQEGVHPGILFIHHLTEIAMKGLVVPLWLFLRLHEVRYQLFFSVLA